MIAMDIQFELETKLNKIGESKVGEFIVDLLNHSMKFSLKQVEGETQHDYTLVFKEVSSLYYISAYTEDRMDMWEPEEGDWIELTSIDYFKNGIGRIGTTSIMYPKIRTGS